MANRKRNIQVKFYVTAEEKELIEQKMVQLQTKRIGAYLRKMAIDGYIIQVDTRDIKEMNKLLSAIGRNINQIAKRVNAGGPTYQADMEEIRERLDQIWQLQRRILLSQRRKRRLTISAIPTKRMESYWCPPSAARQRSPTSNLNGHATIPSTRERT